jgi:2-polyprenyl-3-methyl-5-hydroxy-6-metoxy-1,4-benzoquinol methylase
MTQQFAAPAEVAGRLFDALVAGTDLLSVYVGDALGYYRALAGREGRTSAQLAAACGVHERYAREWLEQQATTGFLAVDDVGAGPGARVYSLPPGYEGVFVDETSDIFLAPAGRFLRVVGANAEKMLDVYRSGGGMSWDEQGDDARLAQAAFNRPFFLNGLVDGYLKPIDGLDAVLSAEGARVAEIGPGGGWAMVAVAKAYPGAQVDGFDLDGPSVTLANANIAEAGVADRAVAHHLDAAAAPGAGAYDLVAAYECIHDMSDPVSVLRAMRRLVKPGGVVLVMDERVAEEFGAFGDAVERLMYGFSLFMCLPDGMSHQPSAGTGTVMRPATLRRYAQEAGFVDIEILPLEHDMFRFYRLV